MSMYLMMLGYLKIPLYIKDAYKGRFCHIRYGKEVAAFVVGDSANFVSESSQCYEYLATFFSVSSTFIIAITLF